MVRIVALVLTHLLVQDENGEQLMSNGLLQRAVELGQDCVGLPLLRPCLRNGLNDIQIRARIGSGIRIRRGARSRR